MNLTCRTPVIIIDNYTSDQELASLQRVAEVRGWDVTALPINAGFAGAMNRGVARAIELGCTTFLMLNPDATVDGTAVEALRRHCLERPMDVVTPKIMDSDGQVHFQGSFLDMSNGCIRSAAAVDRMPDKERVGHDWTAWLTAACLAFSRQVWELVGGMEEGYFLYWEDVDFTVRCARAGANLVVRHDLLAVHDEGGTQGRHGHAKSNIYYFYNSRNRLMFAARRLNRVQTLRWLAATPRESLRILLRGGRRQLLRSPRPLWATVSGTIAGLVVASRSLVVRPHA